MKWPDPPPVLRSPRISLRPFNLSDAPVVQQLCNNRKIAEVTASIGHPYNLEMASDWLSTHTDQWRQQTGIQYAICDASMPDAPLCGAIGVTISVDKELPELGYWLGEPWWGKGFATEAVSLLLPSLAGVFHLPAVQARVLAHNVASTRVLTKNGFRKIREQLDTCGFEQRSQPVVIYSRSLDS